MPCCDASQDLRGQRLDAGRDGGAQPARRGRDPARQDEHPRVRVPLRLQQPGLRCDAQPAQPRALGRRLVGRRGRGARDGHHADRRGLGLRRLDPRARALQRRHGAEARALGRPLRRPLPARAGDVDPALVGDRADGALRRGPPAAAADLRAAGPHDRPGRRAAQRRARSSPRACAWRSSTRTGSARSTRRSARPCATRAVRSRTPATRSSRSARPTRPRCARCSSRSRSPR